ncbi:MULTISPECIES: adaptor protein MecA [Lactiplantibacillus]|uniref:adaptor protein MecA n=1 Tax=Lactiplantibacillus TaxID=2767842 RepID=UPI001C1FA803|nr:MULTISPECIES: adaptor protein MecA [Lactiplantibacillus]MBU7446704.1 adaptor protein MecA [Lactiplantibacillus sp. 7.2.4]MBU7479921.1 adaptor protein MecA [Lactiplantibacillus pentosus]MBU7503324.1 adaptor protein MecA [Lactiplantibacillus pentosus]MDY1545504.1 adaptor protein MecA [Lactiplantibacillus pentosus]
MEMERINEDTIRVVIGNDDLNERGIRVLDLLGNHKQIESFFYSILEEVDVDHQFQDNDAVTFQVLPNRNGLELFISKNSDNLQDTIAKATQSPNQSDDGDSQDDVSDYLKRKLMQTDTNRVEDGQGVSHNPTKDTNDLDPYIDDPDTPTKEYVLKFDQFEDLVSLAQLFRPEGLASNLFKYRDQYYLELVFFVDQSSTATIKDDVAVALEYARLANISADVLLEHGEKIMSNAALETIRHYFH